MGSARSPLEALLARVDPALRQRLAGPEAAGLSEGLARGLEASARYGITRDALLDYLAQRLPDGEKLARVLSNWHTEELALCLACSRGNQQAVDDFRERHLRTVHWTLARLQLPAHQVDELKQRLQVRLLVGDEGRPPLLERFHGLGRLDSWLRVVTASTAHDLLRKQGREVAFHDERIADGLVEGGASLELQQAKHGYRAAFGDAFRAALRQLSPSDLRLIRYRFADDLTLREVAKIYRVNHATILRRLERIKGELLAETQREFRRRLDVDENECASIIRLIQSDFAITMKTFLGDGKRAASEKDRR